MSKEEAVTILQSSLSDAIAQHSWAKSHDTAANAVKWRRQYTALAMAIYALRKEIAA